MAIRSRDKSAWSGWSLGQISMQDQKVIDRMKAAKHAARDADPSGAGDRFAAKYYAGTFDEELNKLAVDTETLWQGYYPSLYNPHTQEAAEHLAAPYQVRIDPLTGEIIEEPEPPAPPPAAPPPKIRYGKGKAKRRGEEWYPGIYGMPIPGRGDNPRALAAAGVDKFNVSTGAPRPQVNPDGELIPWQYANWVVSMGQWRGT